MYLSSMNHAPMSRTSISSRVSDLRTHEDVPEEVMKDPVMFPLGKFTPWSNPKPPLQYDPGLPYIDPGTIPEDVKIKLESRRNEAHAEITLDVDEEAGSLVLSRAVFDEYLSAFPFYSVLGVTGTNIEDMAIDIRTPWHLEATCYIHLFLRGVQLKLVKHEVRHSGASLQRYAIVSLPSALANAVRNCNVNSESQHHRQLRMIDDPHSSCERHDEVRIFAEPQDPVVERRAFRSRRVKHPHNTLYASSTDWIGAAFERYCWRRTRRRYNSLRSNVRTIANRRFS